MGLGWINYWFCRYFYNYHWIIRRNFFKHSKRILVYINCCTGNLYYVCLSKVTVHPLHIHGINCLFHMGRNFAIFIFLPWIAARSSPCINGSESIRSLYRNFPNSNWLCNLGHCPCSRQSQFSFKHAVSRTDCCNCGRLVLDSRVTKYTFNHWRNHCHFRCYFSKYKRERACASYGKSPIKYSLIGLFLGVFVYSPKFGNTAPSNLFLC